MPATYDIDEVQEYEATRHANHGWRRL